MINSVCGHHGLRVQTWDSVGLVCTLFRWVPEIRPKIKDYHPLKVILSCQDNTFAQLFCICSRVQDAFILWIIRTYFIKKLPIINYAFRPTKMIILYGSN